MSDFFNTPKEAIDPVAGNMFSKGEKLRTFIIPSGMWHSDICPPMHRIAVRNRINRAENITGMQFGRLQVIGLGIKNTQKDNKPARWVVR